MTVGEKVKPEFESVPQLVQVHIWDLWPMDLMIQVPKVEYKASQEVSVFKICIPLQDFPSIQHKSALLGNGTSMIIIKRTLWDNVTNQKS